MPPTNPPAPPAPEPLIPDPAKVHQRLAEIARERRLLRRQLRVSLDARRQAAAPQEAPAHA